MAKTDLTIYYNFTAKFVVAEGILCCKELKDYTDYSFLNGARKPVLELDSRIEELILDRLEIVSTLKYFTAQHDKYFHIIVRCENAGYGENGIGYPRISDFSCCFIRALDI